MAAHATTEGTIGPYLHSELVDLCRAVRHESLRELHQFSRRVHMLPLEETPQRARERIVLRHSHRQQSVALWRESPTSSRRLFRGSCLLLCLKLLCAPAYSLRAPADGARVYSGAFSHPRRIVLAVHDSCSQYISAPPALTGHSGSTLEMRLRVVVLLRSNLRHGTREAPVYC